jgi:hypothetical protein
LGAITSFFISSFSVEDADQQLHWLVMMMMMMSEWDGLEEKQRGQLGVANANWQIPFLGIHLFPGARKIKRSSGDGEYVAARH